MANEAQEKLSKLRKSSLVRDDSGTDFDWRVYRDNAGGVFHSVTHILGATAPDNQKQALQTAQNAIAKTANLCYRGVCYTR